MNSSRLNDKPCIRRRGFTLIELLVVSAIILLLLALLLPSLKVARAQAFEVSCRSNHHQIFLAVQIYAGDNHGWFPLAPTENNPHRGLLDALRAETTGLINAMYCGQAEWLESVAQNVTDYPPAVPEYPPDMCRTSVIDTPENRRLGNISYLYWSFRDRSHWRATNHKKYAEPMDSFRPRWLRHSGPPLPFQPSDPLTPCALQSKRLGDYWVMCDFFRQGAPFPHTRKHAGGLNVLYRDGHGEWMRDQPRATFK
jgi:prepilin-type N-terminal cleavage/methylation domain-containing protein/prepilin-type processing-associated H-X9-DG protein